MSEKYQDSGATASKKALFDGIRKIAGFPMEQRTPAEKENLTKLIDQYRAITDDVATNYEFLKKAEESKLILTHTPSGQQVEWTKGKQRKRRVGYDPNHQTIVRIPHYYKDKMGRTKTTAFEFWYNKSDPGTIYAGTGWTFVPMTIDNFSKVAVKSLGHIGDHNAEWMMQWLLQGIARVSPKEPRFAELLSQMRQEVERKTKGEKSN